LPNRILREGILTSERIAKLSWPAEVFYRRLMSVVDDFGRYYATPTLLRAACYPFQLEKVSDSDIGKWIRETEEAALVRVYPAEDGKRYLELRDFRQQVRAKASKFPQPRADVQQLHSVCVADAQQVRADAHLVVSVVEDECGAAPKSRRRSPKVPLPEGFGLSERVIEWAKEQGFDRLPEHLDAFRLKAVANDYRYADWDSAFMAAVKADWARLGVSSSKGRDKFAGAL
jgi:hypothetical protein